MGSTRVDVVIVGQGLAGTAVGWHCHRAGLSFHIVDRGEQSTSSQVAAGLMTPITGQRLVRSWRLDQFWPYAVDYYQGLEQLLGASFFRNARMVRMLATDLERECFERRRADPQFSALVQPDLAPPLDPDAFELERGAFESRQAGQLQTRAYLSASRDWFLQHNQMTLDNLQWPDDLLLEHTGVRLPRLGLDGSHVIFCQGVAGTSNPWFSGVRFKPAKGEILTVRIPALRESRVIHRGIWLALLDGDLYRVGATYEWSQLDDVPTAAGREQLLSELRGMLKLPVEIVDHEAGVRPIHRNQYPVLGFHPRWRQLIYFNGLGSKGALQAPWLARHLVDVLQGKEPLDPEVDVNRREDLQTCAP